MLGARKCRPFYLLTRSWSPLVEPGVLRQAPPLVGGRRRSEMGSAPPPKALLPAGATAERTRPSVWLARGERPAGSPPQAWLPPRDRRPRRQGSTARTSQNRGNASIAMPFEGMGPKTKPHLLKESKPESPERLGFFHCPLLPRTWRRSASQHVRKASVRVCKQHSGRTVSLQERLFCYGNLYGTSAVTSCEQLLYGTLFSIHKKIKRKPLVVLVACPENVVAPKFASAEQQPHVKVPPPSRVRCFSHIHSKSPFGLTHSSQRNTDTMPEGKRVLERRKKEKKKRKQPTK